MKTILVVDDREENLYLLQVLLTHQGYRVATAQNGAEALASARQSPPDLIVTDILMPVMDGYALCREWKTDARLKHIPLVFYTATYTDSGDEQFALDLGADAFIVKPAEQEDFMARIQTVLATTVAQATPARAPAADETVLLKEYNQVLVQKLEQKVLQLEASDQYSQQLFDFAPDGILIADPGSYYLDANPSVCRMLGYRREELIGLHATDIVTASEFRFIQPALNEIKTRSDYQREWQFRRKDGSVFAAEVSVITMPDGNLLAIVRDVTERKQMEASLRNSEAAFRALFESSRDALMSAHTDGNFLSGNPAAVALFGCRDIQEFLTQSPASVSPEFQPDGRRSDEKAQEMLRLAQDHGSHFFEWTHRRMDGTEFFADVLLTLTETGDKPLIHATVRDISERKQAEAELRLRDTQLTLIFDNVCDVIFVIRVDSDGEFCFESMNRRGLELTGLTKDQVFGQRVVDVIPASAHALVLGKYRQAIATRQPASWEEVSDYPAGRKYGIVIVAPVFDTSGHCTQLIGTVHDITARKQSEAKLRVAAAAFESQVGMMITDADAHILRVNRAFTTITGYSPEEVIGKNPNLLSSGRQGADFYAAMWTSLKDNGVWDGEIWNRRKNGELYPEHLTITAVKDAQGNVTNYVGALTDSTQRQKVLNQLRSTASELAHANAQIEEERAMLAQRVAERTAQLQYANHAKDSFLATMSHEIRTPLGGLLGMMELLSLSHLDDRQRDMLAAAQGSGNNLLRIVNDILDWSKIEAGKLELVPHVASVAAMLAGVTKTYGQLASAKGIRLTFEIDDNLSPAHRFDPLRVSQILNNFTSNAIKFTARGTIKISAQRLAQHDGSETVRFCVADSGMGIAPEQQARLFQHYEQASADTARMYGGTGLGLAICRRLAELMAGELSVESTAGVGSTFCLTVDLPVADLAEQRALQSQLAQQESHTEQPDIIVPLLTQGRLPSILVVDDHPVNRMLLKQQLEQLGIQAEVAAYGMVALSRWQAQHFDLVITDCHMPEMDGYELTRSIREIEQHEGRPRIPIIAWTANVLAEEELRCKTAGMDDMLTKPTELSELRAMLLKWLIEPGGPTPAVSPVAAAPAIPPTATLAALDLTVLGKFVAGRAAQIEMLQEFNTQNRSDITSLKTTLQGGAPHERRVPHDGRAGAGRPVCRHRGGGPARRDAAGGSGAQAGRGGGTGRSGDRQVHRREIKPSTQSNTSHNMRDRSPRANPVSGCAMPLPNAMTLNRSPISAGLVSFCSWPDSGR